ncbi:hypothetical protein Tco_1100310 [Tanacetum coccineum]
MMANTEYIRLEEKKARKYGKVFNWETAKYGKIWYDEDIHDLRSVETEFPAIALMTGYHLKHFLVNPRAIRHMALLPCDQRHQYLRYEGLQYTNADIADFEARLIGNTGGRDAQGFGEMVTDLDTTGALQFQLGGTVGFDSYWAESARQILGKGDLRDYWIGISSARDFLGTAPSYTVIWDPILRMCHRLIACSIAKRSKAPKKVTVTDLFYLRGMDIDDTWAWVALILERQFDATVGAPGVAQDALVADEGV